MARPFPNTFEKDSPMSPQSAGGSNISYQTNVNRQKTRKWAEAKAVDYGGDDWGDDDEYDQPPPPISKPTGLRQQGQGLTGTAKADPPAVDSSRKYGELPPLPGADNPRARANSFDADDEKRDFSNSTAQLPPRPAATAPATRFSQITGVPTMRNASGPPALSISTQQPSQAPVGLRKPSQVVSPVVESPHPDVLSPGKVNTGGGSVISPASDTRTPSTASDYHERRDFSPSAVPPPLSTRASPAPQSSNDTPSQRFPARKSSLSQVSRPPVADITRSGTEDTTPKPWTAGRSASPGAATRSPTSPTGKALPFIRPADIYRRAEEERRQSIESGGRPSMDALMGKSSDAPDMPVLGHPNPSIDHGNTLRRRTSFDTEDSSDSGRRLMPLLEPVKERKSEYGFEGFNVNDPESQSAAAHSQEASGGQRNLDVEELRRQSTSPKLPDLNRISGFGMDMFSPSSSLGTGSNDLGLASAPSVPTVSVSGQEDPKLREQPSFGFKSVVHQAFDRTDDNSIPTTPASRTGSGVRRTDSESTSTGTAGISPIMSRVSSMAVPETRTRDTSTPSIMEASEPASPEAGQTSQHDTIFSQDVPGFKPGHRRDLSTPDPDNSPARAPDVAAPHSIAGGQHAVIDVTPPDVASPIDDEPLQAPRPIMGREDTFRPSLPGGWTSYATTARSETPTQAADEVGRSETPASREHDEAGGDLTPTTTKHLLPQSALGAAVAGTTYGEGAHGRHDNASSLEGGPYLQDSRASPEGSDMSTPDHGLPQRGNTSQVPEIGLLPKLRQIPAETQLRPDVIDRPISSQSIPPPPPPKDTPEMDSASDDAEYFPKPTVPLKQRASVGGSNDMLQLPMRPSMLPTLSTDTREYDEENDKLRKEIVKSLSPRPSVAGAAGDSLDSMDESSLRNQNRESSYLPSEYDNYWASTEDGENPAPGGPQGLREPPSQESRLAEHVNHLDTDPVILPLSPRQEAPQSRPTLQNRFSWEDSTENVPAGMELDDDEEDRASAATPAHIYPGAAELPDSNTTTREPHFPEHSPLPEVVPNQEPKEDLHVGRNAAILASGASLGVAALGGAALSNVTSHTDGQPSRRLSLAEEKSPLVTSHPVSPTPPEDEHPSRSPQPYFHDVPELSLQQPVAPSTVSPVASPVQQSSPSTGRILAFREIVAMKTPQQRIQMFNETRQQFATMDSGLSDWIQQIQTQFPEEHGSAGGAWSGPGGAIPGGSTRSKFAKTAGGVAPMQQPYYQQYLNASSPPTPSTPTSGVKPGSGVPTGSQQGFSSTGNKITTQQVQAKGKELLHTAGIFGGKAGKAGKGLLAKGKNKLRAAGGGDKPPQTSPPPKPKADRRSSWGFPLAMSRSSGRPDLLARSSKSSRESTPNHERPRANTLQSERSSPAPQLPAVAVGVPLGVMSGALQTEHHHASPENTQQHDFPPRVSSAQSPVAAEEESEALDSLGPPAPIGKHQPSWDPFNATPIAEEDGFQFEDRPKPRDLESEQIPTNSLSVPADVAAKSDRSNSSDANFFDAREDSEDVSDDWVMVTPEPELEQVVAAQGPPVDSGRLTKVSTREVMPDEELPSSPVQPTVIETTGSPIEQTVTSPVLTSNVASPTAKKAEPESRRSTDTSILNRPRASFSSYDRPQSPPKTPQKPVHVPGLPVASVFQRSPSPPRQITPSAPVQQAEVPVKFVRAEPEKPAGRSSFLPPIRRISTFGFGLGSKAKKERFAIEDDEAAFSGVSAQQQRGEQQPTAGVGEYATSSAFPNTRTSRDIQRGESSLPTAQPPVREQASTKFPGDSHSGVGLGALAGGAAIAAIASHQEKGEKPRATHAENVNPSQLPHQEPSLSREVSPQRQASFDTPGLTRALEHESRANPQAAMERPPAVHATSSEYSDQTVTPQHALHNGNVPLQQAALASPPTGQRQLSDCGERVTPHREPESQHLAQKAAAKPSLLQTRSSDYGERNLTQRDPEKEILFPAARAGDILQRPEFTQSQVEWRPNRPKVVTQPSQGSTSSQAYWKETSVPAARNSWETARGRGYSGSSQNFNQRQDSQYTEKEGWVASPQQNKPFEQPPSAAQRYPELFKPGQQALVESPRGDRSEVDLPAQYYQAPITRAEAFLPRQQTNEYQIPGVGPPTDARAGHSRRNSAGILREMSNRLSRTSSRERRTSASRDRDDSPSDRNFASRGNDYAESSVMSEDGQERQRKRSSFFGALNRNSYSGNSPPKSRESVIAHHAGSKSDLLMTPQPSPVKRSFFGGSSTKLRDGSEPPKQKNKKLVRASTGTLDSATKKNRFSALGGLFGKSGSPKPGQERPQAVRELSNTDRPMYESPQDQPTSTRPPPASHDRSQSRSSRALLSKSNNNAPDSPRQTSKSRRPSAAGLLSGFMGRRSFQKNDRNSDDSRSQGSSQPQVNPQPLLSQTYTDIAEPQAQAPPQSQMQRQLQAQDYVYAQSQVQPRGPHNFASGGDGSAVQQERGRSVSQEPQYDSVPIPGGYSLVRGQGATAVPTQYDPRGLNRPQIDPRYTHQNQPAQIHTPPPQAHQQQHFPNGQGQGYASPQPQQEPFHPQPRAAALSPHGDAPRRPTNEDLLARSPPKPLADQQRPYQLSLPNNPTSPSDSDDELPLPPAKDMRHNPLNTNIQRLAQPQLRHPESPAGYPLPDDELFSPINPSAMELPPPPPPKWPSHLDTQHPDGNLGHDRQASLGASDMELDRSNTRRTAVSAMSNVSAPRPSSAGAGLGVPHAGEGEGVGVGRETPSPMGGTPERTITPDQHQAPHHTGEMQQSNVVVGRRDSTEDLYSASPRIPRTGTGFGSEEERSSFQHPGQNENVDVHGNGIGSAIGKGRGMSPVYDRPADAVLERLNANALGGHADDIDLQPELQRDFGAVDTLRPHVSQREHEQMGRGEQEEKIYYDSEHGHGEERRGVGEEGGPAELEDHETAMSATSYPGQEWNPYGAGAWDEGYD